MRPDRPRKRSRRIALVLMGVAPLALVACSSEEEREASYTSIEACTADGNAKYECEAAETKARATHEAEAPKFTSREECGAEFGLERCQQRTSGGGSFWVPMLAGFWISRVMQGSTPMSSYYAPLYRRQSGDYVRGFSPGPAGSTDDGDVRRGGFAPIHGAANHMHTVSRSGFGRSGSSHFSSSHGS
jgi:uncharacterized protein YgiB involved in biofilm formation